MQHCHDPGLMRSDPDPSSSDLTLIDRVMMGQGSMRNFHIWDILLYPRSFKPCIIVQHTNTHNKVIMFEFTSICRG